MSPVSHSSVVQRAVLAAFLGLLLLLCPSLVLAQAEGETRVAKWKDDRKAAFLLMFDDSWPSHVQVAAPELVKRGLIATFYINPGKGEYLKYSADWQEKLWKQGMVYGNHTMTHKGVKDLENAEWEIGECARIIRQISPGKPDRLVSYGQPGVAKDAWNITPAQLEELLKKHHMIDRPPFTGHGAVYHLKTTEEMLALADKAITSGGTEFLVVHGVERTTPRLGYQDFWPLPQAVFFPLLDALKERSDRGDLWITDHISQHQYETERNSAAAKVVEAGDKAIKLELTTTADPKYYDLPLTWVTRVPAGWKKVKVVHDGKEHKVSVQPDQTVRYDALPDGKLLLLQQDEG